MKREFHLKPDLYAIPIIWEIGGVVFSLAAIFGPRQGDDFWAIQVMMFLLFYGPGMLAAWYIWRARIFVDEDGVAFRGLFKTQCVAWEQIEDFGWDCSKSRVWAAMLWTGGKNKKKQLLRLYKGFDELRELVAERAVNAPARTWELVGARDCDEWPQTFGYRDTPNWKIAALFLGATMLMALQLLGAAPTQAWEALTQIWDGLEAWERIGLICVVLFKWLAMPILMTALFFLGLRGKRRFLEQCIVVSREGLEQWNGPSRRVCTWDAVERFELEQVAGALQLPLCVLWARGQRFDWHISIEKGLLLNSIVQQRATNAQTDGWKYRSGADKDILGGELSLWPSGVVGVGAKRYHYRTRTGRALLWYGATMLSVVFIAPVARGLPNPMTSADVLNFLGVLLLFSPVILLTLGGLRAYFGAWIERDEEGLHHASIFGKRHLPWGKIRRVQLNEHFLEIRGDKTKIRVGPLADQEHLLGDIERHSGVKVEKIGKMRSGV